MRAPRFGVVRLTAKTTEQDEVGQQERALPTWNKRACMLHCVYSGSGGVSGARVACSDDDVAKLLMLGEQMSFLAAVVMA